VAVLVAATVGGVHAQDTEQSNNFVLLPDDGQTAVGAGFLDLDGSEDGAQLSFGYFGPMSQSPSDLLMYDIGVDATFDDEYDLVGYGFTAGLFYRYSLAETSVLGFNAYVEGTRSDADGELLGQASVGAEYEYRPVDGDWFAQGGGNYYRPFDDYTNVAEFGNLSAAPREGLDAYISVGRDFDGLSLRGSLIGFNYFDTPTALALTGYGLDTEIETSRGLPDGMNVGVSLGLRTDSRDASEPSAIFGVSLEYAFGGGGRRVPDRDCALVRVEGEQPQVDCGEAVILMADGDITGKEDEPVARPLPGPRGVIVDRPRRNLGFGSAFVPIEEDTPPEPQPEPASLIILLSDVIRFDTPNDFRFELTVDGQQTPFTLFNGTDGAFLREFENLEAGVGFTIEEFAAAENPQDLRLLTRFACEDETRNQYLTGNGGAGLVVDATLRPGRNICFFEYVLDDT